MQHQSAVGGNSQGGNLASIPTSRVSSRDNPTHKPLKRRRKIDISSRLGPDLKYAPEQAIEKVLSLAPLAHVDPSISKYAEQDQDAEASSSEDESETDSKKSYIQDSDDESDEEEALQRELDALRRERELAEEAKKKSEEKTQLQKLAESMEETKVIKSWEEDTVFRVPVIEERQRRPKFVNDAIRSEFHKRFLKKYIA